MTARNLTLVPPEARAESAPGRLAEAQRVIAAIIAEDEADFLRLVIALQERAAEVSERGSPHKVGVAEIARALLAPLNVAEAGLRRLQFDSR